MAVCILNQRGIAFTLWPYTLPTTSVHKTQPARSRTWTPPVRVGNTHPRKQKKTHQRRYMMYILKWILIRTPKASLYLPPVITGCLCIMETLLPAVTAGGLWMVKPQYSDVFHSALQHSDIGIKVMFVCSFLTHLWGPWSSRFTFSTGLWWIHYILVCQEAQLKHMSANIIWS